MEKVVKMGTKGSSNVNQPEVAQMAQAQAQAVQMFKVQSLVLATSVFHGTGSSPATVEECAKSFYNYLTQG